MPDTELARLTQFFGAELTKMKQQIRTLQQGVRQAQLIYSSIDDGQLPVVDANGVVRQVIGVQSDGTVTTNDVNAPSPPIPSTPVVGPGINGLTVGWDGTFASSAPLNTNSRFTISTDPWTITNVASLAWGQDASGDTFATLNGTGTATPGMQSEQEPVFNGQSYTAYAFVSSPIGWVTGATVSINWFDTTGAPISSVTSTAVPLSIDTEQLLSISGIAAQDGYATVTVALAGNPATNVVMQVLEGSLIQGAGVDTPADFWHVEVHLSIASGFTPSPATLQGTMVAAGSLGCLNLTPDTTYYAVLVAVNTSGSSSLPSAQASAVCTSVLENVPPGSITAPFIAANAIVAGMIAAGAIDGQVINGIQMNSSQLTATDLIISGPTGGIFIYGTGGTITQVWSQAGTYSWVAPVGVTAVMVECWGGGGGGQGGNSSSSYGGRGGGAGEYAAESALAVIPGNSYAIVVGAAGQGPGTSFNGSPGGASTFGGTGVVANPGQAGSVSLAPGGTGSTNSVHNPGGRGGFGAAAGNNYGAGGGGGGSGGPSAAGNHGNDVTSANPGTYGPGATAVPGGGPGGDGGRPFISGQAAGVAPNVGPGGGGGGGSCYGSGASIGGSGMPGQVRLTYTTSAPRLIGSIAGQAVNDPVSATAVPEGFSIDDASVGTQLTLPDGSVWSTTQLTLATRILRDPWHSFNPLLSNGWTVPSGGFARYCVSAENELRITAVLLAPSSSVNGVTIATFPVGARPSSLHQFDLTTTGLNASTGNGFMTLSSGGVMQSANVVASSTVGIEARIPLDV